MENIYRRAFQQIRSCPRRFRPDQRPLLKGDILVRARPDAAPARSLSVFFAEMHEAVAAYTARAAEKLRRQNLATASLVVFIETNRFKFILSELLL
jgi:hypothetical protein